MVLILDNELQETFPKSTKQLFKSFTTYKDTARTFLKKEIKDVDPKGLLYVGQCEFAVSIPEDKNLNLIGSDDATTCIISILRHSKSGATAVAHFDGTDMEEVISKMTTQIQDLSAEKSDGKIELQLIGGYSDENNYSEDIFYEAMRIFQSLPNEIDLRLSCIGNLNTVVKNGVPWPIIYGAGIDLKTGEVFPAKFSEKGPEVELRNARLYSLKIFAEIYDSKRGLFKIDPFSYEYKDYMDVLLGKNDTFILKHSSTSPLVEPPDYVQHVRRTFNFMKNNPDPLSTVFKNNKSHYFKRDVDCRSWIPIDI